MLDKLDYCSNLNNLRPVSNLLNFKFVKGDIGSVRGAHRNPNPAGGRGDETPCDPAFQLFGKQDEVITLAPRFFE